MLNDNHIHKFKKLLKRESNKVFSMQSILLLNVLDDITPIASNKKHIQILFSGHSNHGHWI